MLYRRLVGKNDPVFTVSANPDRWPRACNAVTYVPPENYRCMNEIQTIGGAGVGPAEAWHRLHGAPILQRAHGEVRLGFVAVKGKTCLAECFQAGSAKVLLPRTFETKAREAVLLNTAGGLTGGDHLAYRVSAGPGSLAVVSTQAAERIYRRVAGTARIEAEISVGSGARLDWLPQETILFDRSALSRRLIADVASDATLLAAEAIVLGRAAMGETVQHVAFGDGWRIRRDNKLIFADGIRLDGNATAIMSGSATGGGAVAFATVLLVSPEASALVDAARETIACGLGEGGASVWNDMLVARLAAPSGQALRNDLVALVECLRGSSMPRVWYC
jgi:urease accessory protein